MGTIITILILVLYGLLLAGGIYFKSYFNKRGENLATKEDFRELKAQTAELRQTTKEIEVKIDDQVWNRQRQWELRRDVLFDTSRRLAQVDDALLSLNTVSCDPATDGDPAWLEAKIERQHNWTKASTALSESQFFVGVVCEKETIDAIDAFVGISNKIAAELTKNRNVYSDRALELTKKLYAARHAIRKELGIDSLLTSRSNRTSATPNG